MFYFHGIEVLQNYYNAKNTADEISANHALNPIQIGDLVLAYRCFKF